MQFWGYLFHYCDFLGKNSQKIALMKCDFFPRTKSFIRQGPSELLSYFEKYPFEQIAVIKQDLQKVPFQTKFSKVSFQRLKSTPPASSHSTNPKGHIGLLFEL